MNALARECTVFTRHLLGRDPDDFVLTKYAQLHHRGDPRLAAPAGSFDRCLLALARTHPLATRLADGYARLFLRRSLLRRKLVLLLAVLESCAPWHHHVEAVNPCRRWWLWMRLGWSVALALLTLLIAVVLFAPWHLLLAGLAAVRREVRASEEGKTPSPHSSAPLLPHSFNAGQAERQEA